MHDLEARGTARPTARLRPGRPRYPGVVLSNDAQTHPPRVLWRAGPRAPEEAAPSHSPEPTR